MKCKKEKMEIQKNPSTFSNWLYLNIELHTADDTRIMQLCIFSFSAIHILYLFSI